MKPPASFQGGVPRDRPCICPTAAAPGRASPQRAFQLLLCGSFVAGTGQRMESRGCRNPSTQNAPPRLAHADLLIGAAEMPRVRQGLGRQTGKGDTHFSSSCSLQTIAGVPGPAGTGPRIKLHAPPTEPEMTSSAAGPSQAPGPLFLQPPTPSAPLRPVLMIPLGPKGGSLQ